jgi:sulfoxide reductase heme-binding subunit YedZ
LTSRKLIKGLVFALCLVPAALLIWRGYNDDLGANPIEAVIRNLGDWGLRFLLLDLAITPARQLFGWNALASYRRMIGLFSFTYISLHLSAYIGLDQFFAWGAIWRDIVKRPYITFGMVAWLVLVPLAITSTNAMAKRLGAKRWRALHRLVYAAGIAGVVHYLLLVKADIRDPILYIAILAVLLAIRIVFAVRLRLRRLSLRRGFEPSQT